MSDIKPKRVPRVAAAPAMVRGEAVAGDAALTITPEPEVALALEPVPAATPAVALEPAPAVMPGVAPEPAPAATSATDPDPWISLAEAQAAFTRGLESMVIEVSGMTHSGMAATADAALALLGARTLAEAVEINAGLTRRGIDAFLAGSARLSEIGAKAISDATRPILAPFGGGPHIPPAG